jgi:hypothetical protein
MSCSSLKQKGGGVFDVYCPLCNLPFYSPFEGQKIPTDDDDEDEDLYELRHTKLDWLSDVLGVDDNTSTVLELKGGDNLYGEFSIKKGGRFGLRDSVAVEMKSIKKDKYKGFGAAFHKDCFKYISQKSGRPINYQLGVDIEQTIKDYFKAHPMVRRDDDYQQQTYDFEGALDDNGPDYFVSPLETKGKHVRGLLNDFVPKKSTPSPQKNKSPSPAKPVNAVNPVNANVKSRGSNGCASQKAKEVCVQNKDCVWGKTNRCSKRRSTQKKSNAKTNKQTCPSNKDKNQCIKNNCVWGKTNRCSKKRVSRK